MDALAPVTHWISGEFHNFYSDSLQSPLFTAFLTLAGLLFGVHNFLLINLHRDIYGKPRYRQFARRAEPGRHPLDRLENFSQRLRWSVVVCFVASVMQFSLGFVENGWVSIACVAVALAACWQLARMYKLQHSVISGWLEYLKWEADRDDEAESDAEESASEANDLEEHEASAAAIH